MSWKDRYRSKLVSAEEAVRAFKPWDRVYMGGNAATPVALARALAARAEEVQGLSVGHVLLLGEDPFADARARGLIRHHAWFVGPADRAAVNEGSADFVPAHLSEIPRLLRAGHIDGAMLMTSPPDKQGFLSLGVEVMASLAAAQVAEKVVVQVNPYMPRVHGNAFLHVDEVTHIVELGEPLREVVPPPPSEVEQAIASHIVPLIPERATLQLGIGGVPNAVVAQLEGRTGLGVHSEMISDGVMQAWESGVLTGEHKSLHAKKVVMTFAMGSRELYDWLDDNAHVESHPCDHTNNVFVASRLDRLVAINSALSVDLTGQVNADSIGTRIYSGVGGQVDFIRAAAHSRGGVPVIALPSTAQGGKVSRIVPTLQLGAGVVTSRASVHWVATEHGAVNLFGASLRERTRRLISIADPRFRDELTEAARARGLA